MDYKRINDALCCSNGSLLTFLIRVESNNFYKVEMGAVFPSLLLSKGKKTVLSKVVEGLPWWYSG